jgi:hypothetical protein
MSIEEATHRGIRWQRNSKAQIRWRNEDQDRWVRWRPGDDAPPRPPGWERRGSADAAPPLTRPAWRSPYRIVPVVLVVVVLALGLYQAFGSGGSSSPGTSGKQETAQAEAYAGRCLPKVGTGPSAGYSSKPVTCDAPDAAGKVVAVVTSQAGPKACPSDTTPAILTTGVVAHPHFECILALAGP